jgi:hypothetical protein
MEVEQQTMIYSFRRYLATTLSCVLYIDKQLYNTLIVVADRLIKIMTNE